jgi:hypothetical protein
MLNFVYLRSSRLHFLHFWLDSCIANKGEKFELVLACCIHLEGFQVVSSCFWAQAISQVGGAHRSDRCSSQVLGDLVHQSDRWGWPVWPVRAELLQLLYFMKWFTCIRPGGVALVQGELFVVSSFGLVVCAFAWACFVSDVSSRCPWLRGPRLVFFKWSYSLPFSLAFDRLLEVLIIRFFYFVSLGLLYVCVVNALIKGEIEDHVRFEDRWMVAS